MKAIIMAGGEGSRLRPLTCDIPKPLTRLCGKPVLEYILDLLDRHSFTQAAITLRYLPDLIVSHFPDASYRGVELSFAEEDKPLGTAGSVRNACGPEDDMVLVISGDAMCDFDLSRAVEFHRRHEADATIFARKVDDPREYGLIDADESGRIAAFIEKPAFSQAVSDLANTGIYILSKAALDMIPTDTFYDFAKDLFPKMLREGKKLMCLEEEGYWCDIGDLDTYIRCQMDVLAGRVACEVPGTRDAQGNVFAGRPPVGDCVIVPPVYIGKNVTLEQGARLEGAVVDDGCYIGENARVSGSVLLPNSYVGRRARLTGALVCAGGSVKPAAMLFEGATVGAGAVVGEKATVNAGVRIWNQKVIEPSATVEEHVRVGGVNRGFFGDDGIAGQIGVELTPEFLARLGSAVGSFRPGAKIAVGSSCHQSARVLKEALCAGILSTGSSTLDFGENFRAQFEFAMNFCSVGLGVYIRGGNRAGVTLMTDGGLPANRETERSVEGILARGEFVRTPHDRMGETVRMDNTAMLYRSQLLRFAPRGLGGMAARVRSQNVLIQDMLRETIFRLGCDVGDGFTLEISSEGDRVRINSEETGYIPHHRILALCAVGEMEKQEDIALPFDAPRFLDDAARENGVRLYRYYDCPADSSDLQARKIARHQMWSRDGLMQAVMLLSLMKKAGGAEKLMHRHPDFSMAVRTVETPGNPAGILRGMGTHRAGEIAEGVILDHERGIILVKPLKRGTGLRILAEAASSEIAEEICADVEKLITEGKTPPLTQ